MSWSYKRAVGALLFTCPETPPSKGEERLRLCKLAKSRSKVMIIRSVSGQAGQGREGEREERPMVGEWNGGGSNGRGDQALGFPRELHAHLPSGKHNITLRFCSSDDLFFDVDAQALPWLN